MRRLLLLFALVGVALLAWRLGTGAWPLARFDEVVGEQGEADEVSEPKLRGRGPEAGVDATASDTKTPDPPPGWPHGTITGRVVGWDGERPPGAGVSALGVHDTFGNVSLYGSAFAGADGHFVLYAKADVPTIVVAGAPGHGSVLGPRVQLAAGATQDVGTLHLAHGRELPVRVVDEGGEAVEDVEVWLTSETDPLPEGWELAFGSIGILKARATDADGRVLFDRLPPGSWMVAIQADGWDTRVQRREHVEANGEDVVFVLPPRSVPHTIRVHLQVLGPDGVLVPQATVGLEAEDASEWSRYVAGSEEHFELECGAGPVRLVVNEARGADGTLLGYAPAVIPDARELSDPVVVRLERGATITGRVSWDGDASTWKVRAVGWFDAERGMCDPSPETTADDVYMRFETQAAADGSFRLVEIPPGRFRVSASGPGLLRDPAPVVQAGATDVVLETMPEGRLEVHVLPPSGLPIGWTVLELDECHPWGVEGRGHWWGGGGTGPDVRVYDVDDLRLDGRFRLSAYALCAGVRCRAALSDVVPREEPYVLRLEQTPHVRGVVEREDGTPVGGVQVRYLAWPGGELRSNPNILLGGPWLWFSLSDAQGAFDLSGLGEQELVLGITGLGLTLRDAPPRVLPGATGVRLVVVPERRISGRVVDPAGGTLDGLRAAAFADEGRPRLWTPYPVAADGFFEVRGLAPGTHRILVWNERDETDARSVLSEPLPAGQRDVRLELAPGAVLEGVVRDHEGRSLPTMTLRLHGRWTNRVTATDGEGHYAFNGIPPDVELEAEVLAPTGPSIRKTVRVTQTAEPTTLDLTLPIR